jgi:hypothetical protein
MWPSTGQGQFPLVQERYEFSRNNRNINPETTAAPKIGVWMIENGPKFCINVIFHPVLCLY